MPVPWASVTLRAECSPALTFPPAPGWLIQLPTDSHTSHINTVFSFPVSPKGSENTCARGTHACTHTIAYVFTCAHTHHLCIPRTSMLVYTHTPHSCTCHIHMSPCTHILFIKASLSHRISWGRLGPQTPGRRWRRPLLSLCHPPSPRPVPLASESVLSQPPVLTARACILSPHSCQRDWNAGSQILSPSALSPRGPSLTPSPQCALPGSPRGALPWRLLLPR